MLCPVKETAHLSFSFFFILWLLLLTPQAYSAESSHILIDGFQYPTSLRPADEVLDAVPESHALLVSSEHWQGRLSDMPDSWVRLSKVGQEWQGVVSTGSQLYLLAGDADSTPQARPVAQALNDDGTEATCATGAEHSAITVPDDDSFSAGGLEADGVSFNELCPNTIDGICLLSELYLVFDHHFQQQFPDTFQDKALAIMNVVEGFYEQDMDTDFDTLSIQFPSQELFSNTTDATAFLDAITEKKSDQAFIDNQAALLHVITGRDFDGSTVGFAWIEALCNQNGFSSATSQYLQSSAVTAIIVAHELGHNFGARHDGNDNTCSTDFIMAPFVNSDAEGFSSCSVSEMRSHISALSDPARCFNFPADASIQASDTNPEFVDGSFSNTVTLNYSLGYKDSFERADNLVVSGEIADAGASYLRITVNGRSCIPSLLLNSFRCSTTPTSDFNLEVEIAPAAEQIDLTHAVAISDSDVIDRLPGNNSVDTTLQVAMSSQQPNDLSADEDEENEALLLTWTDRAIDEDGYVVERRAQGEDAWLLLDNLPANSNRYRDTTVTEGVFYDYRVTAQSDTENNSSNIATGILEFPPNAPAQLDAAGKETRAALNWEDRSDNETGFRLERQRKDGSDGDDWQTAAMLEANTTIHSDLTVVPGNIYRYRVFAVNHTHESNASNDAEADLRSTGASSAGGGSSGGGGGAIAGVLLLTALALRRPSLFRGKR